MPSYEIPESVIGVPLFVPEANDYFEIVTGGMPNGDDCLRVRGDLSSNYKAYMSAPATTPDIAAASTTVMAMTIWVKLPATAGHGVANLPYGTVILSVMNGNNASLSANGNGAWSLSAVSTNILQFYRTSAPTNASSTFVVNILSGVRDNNWHMITVHTPALSGTYATGGIYLDNAITPSSTDAQSTASTATATQYLCIGKYSDLAGPTAYAADYQLGKLAFHDHWLNQTERSLLYQSMVG